MRMIDGLPVRKMFINEDIESSTYLEYISAVESPAIGVDFVAFNNNIKLSSNDEQKKLAGPIMIPDLPIYRRDSLGEYYALFESSEIEKIMRKFLKQGRTMAFNIEHSDKTFNGILDEFWYVSDENDKSKDFGFNLPKGTAFGVVKVEDDKIWNDYVKTKKVKGFSIEGFLNIEMRKINKQNMNTNIEIVKFEKVKTVDGEIFVDGDIAVDSYVYSATPYVQLIDGKRSEVQSLCYESVIELEDGNILFLEGGRIIKIEQKEATSTPTETPVAQTKTKEIKMELTPDDIQMIQDAIQPIIDEMNKRITALEDAMKNTNGGEQSTPADTQMSEVNSLTTPNDNSKPKEIKMSLREKINQINLVNKKK